MNEVLREKDTEFVANTYARFSLAAKSGKGAVCTDFDGKEYIDFTSGIGVNCLGFCDEGWTEAVSKQLTTLQHISNLFYTEPCVQLAETLCGRTGMKRVFFGNSGAEANEGAVKAARKYSHDKYGEGRHEIITLINSFHGRTVTMLAATGQDGFHKNFAPFTEGFVYAPANDFESFLKLVTEKTCAVMLEFIQGEGGVLPLQKEFVTKVASLCKEKDILLIADEVQTGVGRTGTLYCYEQFGVKPDILTSAKGLGGGLPIGAVLFGEKTADVLTSGDHGTTFGGNPVVCAGGNYILSKLDDAFLKSVAEKGAYIKDKVLKMENVKSVAGMGLMIGIEIEGQTSKEAAAACLRKGLIVLTAKEKVRLLPPLTIEYAEIDKGLAILAEVLRGV